MKSIYSITGSLILILGLLAGSCTKQLNQQPPSLITTAQFYSNTADFTQAVTGAYNQLRAYPDQVLWLGEMRSDNIYATSDGNRDWQGIRNFSPNLTTVGFITSAWDNNFNGIYNVNSVLDNLKTQNKIENDEQLLAALKQENMTMADLRRNLERQMIATQQLPELIRRMRDLEKQVADLKSQIGG